MKWEGNAYLEKANDTVGRLHAQVKHLSTLPPATITPAEKMQFQAMTDQIYQMAEDLAKVKVENPER